MSPDVEYEEYEAPKQPPFFKFEVPDAWYRITFVKRLADSDQFEVGSKKARKPAEVWLIEENGDEYRFTLTSSRFLDTMEWAKKKLAEKGIEFVGTPIEYMPVGREKERTFKARIPKGA